MRVYTVLLIAIVLLSAALAPQAVAERASPAEAANVAENWVTQEIARDGNWGGSPEVDVGAGVEFRRGTRLLGYYFPVTPQGFVVQSGSFAASSSIVACSSSSISWAFSSNSLHSSSTLAE